MTDEQLTIDAAEAAQYADPKNLEARMRVYKSEEQQTLWERLWSFYGFKDSEQVLELGCGNGEFWVQNLSKVTPEMTLLLTDLSEGMIAAARDRINLPNVSFQIQNAEDLTCADAAHTYVLAHFMLYHVPDQVQAIKHIARVLTDDGNLGVVLPVVRQGHVAPYLKLSFELAPELEKPYWETSTISFGADEFLAIAEDLFTLETRVDEVNLMHFENGAAVCDFLWSLPVFQSDLVAPTLRKRLEEKADEYIKTNGKIVEEHPIALMRLKKR